MRTIQLGIVFAGAFMAPLASAGIIYNDSDVTPGNAVAAACAGSQVFGGGLSPGHIYCAGFGATYVIYGTDEQPATATAFESASNSIAGVYSNSSWASATQGELHMYSTNTETANVSFAGTVADAGWNDTVTITNGTGDGIWKVKIWVDGELTAPGGYASSAQLNIVAFKDNNWLTPTADFYADNNSYCKQYGPSNCAWIGARNSTAYGYQSVHFAAYNSNYGTTYGVPDTVQDLIIGQYVTFEIPFTYNVPFELGIWADTGASVGSSGAYPTSSTANLGNTMLWGGSSVSGNPTFLATGLNGFNYNNAIAPEPSCFALAAGILGLGAAFRKRLGGRAPCGRGSEKSC